MTFDYVSYSYSKKKMNGVKRNTLRKVIKHFTLAFLKTGYAAGISLIDLAE